MFFNKAKTGISNLKKKSVKDDLWIQCNQCKETFFYGDLIAEKWVCKSCYHHFRISARNYIDLLTDNDSFKEFDSELKSKDPLNFYDKKKYKDRLNTYIKKTGQNSAVISGLGKIFNQTFSIGAMEFKFGGGSMGTVEGEKITRVFKRAIEYKCPAVIISKSGGARMQEGSFSLLQMAKTSAYIGEMNRHSLPYICVLTDPTTGGVTASFAMLGDIHIAEPNALIGFAGARVVQETIGEKLPKNFQKAEFLMEKGFIDMIVDRPQLKEELYKVIQHLSRKCENQSY